MLNFDLDLGNPHDSLYQSRDLDLDFGKTVNQFKPVLTLTLENLLAGKTVVTGSNRFFPRSERHVEKSPDEFGENRKKYSNSNTEMTKLFKEKSPYKIKKRKGVTFFSI